MLNLYIPTLNETKEIKLKSKLIHIYLCIFHGWLYIYTYYFKLLNILIGIHNSSLVHEGFDIIIIMMHWIQSLAVSPLRIFTITILQPIPILNTQPIITHWNTSMKNFTWDHIVYHPKTEKLAPTFRGVTTASTSLETPLSERSQSMIAAHYHYYTQPILVANRKYTTCTRAPLWGKLRYSSVSNPVPKSVWVCYARRRLPVEPPTQCEYR